MADPQPRDPIEEESYSDRTNPPSPNSLPSSGPNDSIPLRSENDGERRTSSQVPQVAERKLSAYFPGPATSSGSVRRLRRYTDEDLQDIAYLLSLSESESWSRVPRIYTVLRCIGQLPLLNEFVKEGFTDIWIPFAESDLPSSLSQSIKTQFINAQPVVFTEALDLEKGERGKHVTFDASKPIWFESRGELGRGAHGVVDKVVSLITLKVYARKQMRRGSNFTKSKKEIQTFEKELDILRTIDHQHCVRLVGGSSTDHTVLATKALTFYRLEATPLQNMSVLSWILLQILI
jgi:hypothetical protein